MNPQEAFDAWKAQKRQVEVSADFAGRVIAGVHRWEESAQPATNPQPLLNYLTARPWARAAVLVAGTLLGLARIAVTIHFVLFA